MNNKEKTKTIPGPTYIRSVFTMVIYDPDEASERIVDVSIYWSYESESELALISAPDSGFYIGLIGGGMAKAVAIQNAKKHNPSADIRSLRIFQRSVLNYSSSEVPPGSLIMPIASIFEQCIKACK